MQAETHIDSLEAIQIDNISEIQKEDYPVSIKKG
jgi:hypothetical protein